MVFIGIIENNKVGADDIVSFFSKKEHYSLLFVCLSFEEYRKVPFAKKKKAAVIFTRRNEDSFTSMFEISYLKQLNNDSHIIMLGDEYDDIVAMRMARCGATGFVKRPFTFPVIESCMHEIKGGNFFFPYSRQKERIKEVIQNQRDKNGNSLSLREFEIIELLRRGLTNKQIGNILCISPHTVNSHLKNIFTKFNVQSRGSLVNKILEFYQ